MPHDAKLIDEILSLSKECNSELYNKITHLLEKYYAQTSEHKKVMQQNEYFLKEWDKRNLLQSQKDATKDMMLEQQSRLAAMGEMIDAVAHQWKQPLNAISMLVDILKSDFDKSQLSDSSIVEFSESIHLQIDHMVTTLAEFRDFLRPSTKNEEFFMQEIYNHIQILMKDELISQNLHIIPEIDEDVKIFGNKNEFKHLFLNLINNSIDAFNEKRIKKRELIIRSYKEGERVYIEVEDNAGGIPEAILPDIFKPNVTTKPKGKGTGIGLYMSYQIVKKNNGEINVHNTQKGAFFTIILHRRHL